MEKEKLVCKFNHSTGEYSCKDKEGNVRKQGKCGRNPKGKQGGGSIMGTGGNYGSSRTEITCDDHLDMKRQIQNKYKDFDIEMED
ncbi:MAG: hypothetical protein M1416_01275 [Candidatus Pacearchaeota archaeon]|nr:hypothetical protein [Candidatus Pacearchaeota archaeon]